MNIRDKIQSEATQATRDNKFNGIMEIAPRVGKTKITIDALNFIKNKTLDVLVVAPKTPIFDSWKTEIIKWGLNDNINISYVWSNSLKKNNKDYHLIIADEIHEYNDKVLQELRVRQLNGSRILALTGTLDEQSEYTISKMLKLHSFYKYSVDQAIKDKIVSDYSIICIGCELDDTDKYIEAGNQNKVFYQTELQAYTYWDNRYNNAVDNGQYSSLKFLMSKRKDIIYNSKTKLNKCLEIVNKLDRCIIFTGYQKIADSLGEGAYHSKSDKSNIDKFKDGLLNKLSVVSMVSMGLTFPNLKNGVFNQLRSGENLAIQQAMRTMNVEEDKKATIWITYLKNTRDEEWLKSALKGFDQSKIIYK